MRSSSKSFMALSSSLGADPGFFLGASDPLLSALFMYRLTEKIGSRKGARPPSSFARPASHGGDYPSPEAYRVSKGSS